MAKGEIPAYRGQRGDGTDRAFVVVSGKRHYLGTYGTSASRTAYHRLMAEWSACGRRSPAKPGGRPRDVDMREVVNAMLYVVRTGGSWRQLPHDFPPWETVYRYFRDFQRDGTWKRIHDRLRARVRKKAGKRPTPSVGILDSQSVKTAEKGGTAGTTRARKPRAASGI